MVNMQDFNDEVRNALKQLDGSSKSAILLLTGLDEDELNELGGMPDNEEE